MLIKLMLRLAVIGTLYKIKNVSEILHAVVWVTKLRRHNTIFDNG